MEEIEGVKISQLPKASAVSDGDLIPGVINGETQAIDVKLLKGQKGDQGEPGPAGPQGEQGPQGEPGTGAQLYEEYGNNTDGALTQKFISDVLNANNVAIGSSAKTGTAASLAIGFSAKSENYSAAIGAGARTLAAGALAIGNSTEANNSGSVALGINSKTKVQGEVNIGTTNTVYGYKGTNSRVLSGVHEGVDDDHAVNLAQLKEKLSEHYTKVEVDQMISTIPKFAIAVVETLPTENISATTVYLVPSGESSPNLYKEYIYVDGKWESLGEQSVDLSDYYNKTESDNKFVDKTAIVQSTGESTTTIMSQKAITDMIGGVEARLVSLNSGEGVQNDNQ